MKRTLAAAALAIGGIAASGCSLVALFVAPQGRPIVIDPYQLRPPAPFVDSFRAGVGKVDITPPAGFPTGGHGPAGNMSRGTWTRLYARAFFFAHPQGQAVVLVSCDLFAMPGGVTAAVARAVSTKWNARGVTIPRDAITIAATHTHQSPGNFLTSSIYNAYGSKYGGFSPALFDFLVTRIASAIDISIADALEHDEATLALHSARTSDLQLNRSPRTFLLNGDAQAIMSRLHDPLDVCAPTTERGEARADWDLFGCPRLRGADPILTVLEIKRGGARAGALVFFADHPTVLDHGAAVYSSDFVGVAMSTLERRTAPAPGGAAQVFGFFNGPEGDVVPTRSARDVRDVTRVASRFVGAVESALRSPADDWHTPALVAKATSLTAGAACVDPPSPVWEYDRLSRVPIVGAPALGGGEDDRTLLFQLGFHEGLRDIARRDQGGKLPGLDSQLLPFVRLTSTFSPPRAFPRELPLRYLEIGGLIVATLPAEVSTTAGFRIRERVSGDRPMVIVGLANEYVGYMATAEEYAAQDYMAASTVWGPGEAAVFGCQIAKLQAARTAPELTQPREKFYPGARSEQVTPKLTLGPHAVGEVRSAPDEELEDIVRDTHGAPDRRLPTVVWSEWVPDVPSEFRAAAHRLVRVLVNGTQGWERRTWTGSSEPDDDGGPGFITVLRAAPNSTDDGIEEHRMAAIWLGPVLEARLPDYEYRFEIEFTNEDSEIVAVCRSGPFRVDPSDTAPVPLLMACTPYSESP